MVFELVHTMHPYFHTGAVAVVCQVFAAFAVFAGSRQEQRHQNQLLHGRRKAQGVIAPASRFEPGTHRFARGSLGKEDWPNENEDDGTADHEVDDFDRPIACP